MYIHAKTSLIPASDHRANASLVRERLLARIFCRPKLFPSLFHGPSGVDRYSVLGLDNWPNAFFDYCHRSQTKIFDLNEALLSGCGGATHASHYKSSLLPWL